MANVSRLERRFYKLCSENNRSVETETHKCCGLFKQYLLTSSSVRGYVGFIHGDGAVCCVKINYLSSFGLFLLLCNIVASPALLHFFFFFLEIGYTVHVFIFLYPPLL